MKDELKKSIGLLQTLVFDAYLKTGQLAAAETNAEPEQILSQAAVLLEDAAVIMRNICETHRTAPNTAVKPNGVARPPINLAGSFWVNEDGWTIAELNTLLPGCRFETPKYLVDSLIRLLDDYEHQNRLPYYSGSLLLIIHELSNIENRVVFDQDNKAWKAIPNVFKGRLFEDDDQYQLGICLISSKIASGIKPCTRVYLLPQDDAGCFFDALASGCLVTY